MLEKLSHHPQRGTLTAREGRGEHEHFRVWIVVYQGPPPTNWRETPAGAIAVEPAEPGTMSARQAGVYVEAFNRAAVENAENRWAIALPVAVRYEGDPQPGQWLGLAGQQGAAPRKKTARCWPVRYRPATGFHRGNSPDASCGVPVRTPAMRQSHQTP